MDAAELPEVPMEISDDQEWEFYKAYWPSGSGMPVPVPPPSEASTADPGAAPEERDAKAARLEVAKGSPGRGGGGDGKGSAESSAGGKRRHQTGSWRGGGGNGGGGQGHGGGGGYGGQADWQRWSPSGHDGAAGSQKEIKELRYAVTLLQRLILRHEDSTVLSRIECSFVVHLRMNVQASVVPMLFAAAGAWRKVKKEEPEKLDRPMRCALLVCFLAELKSRMESVVTQPENMERMSKLGWVSPGPPVMWHFLRWDPANQKQVVDSGKTPLSQAEILELLAQAHKLIPQKFVLGRFHPTRPMAQEMKGSNLVFLLQTGMLGEAAAEFRECLRKLCHCAAMNLMAGQLKEDRQARSALANAIAECLTRSL